MDVEIYTDVLIQRCDYSTGVKNITNKEFLNKEIRIEFCWKIVIIRKLVEENSQRFWVVVVLLVFQVVHTTL